MLSEIILLADRIRRLSPPLCSVSHDRLVEGRSATIQAPSSSSMAFRPRSRPRSTPSSMPSPPPHPGVLRRRKVGGHARRHGGLLRDSRPRRRQEPPGCSACWSATPVTSVGRASCASTDCPSRVVPLPTPATTGASSATATSSRRGGPSFASRLGSWRRPQVEIQGAGKRNQRAQGRIRVLG